MEPKTVYVTIKVRIWENADPQLVVNEMDYELRHALIVDTEVFDVDENFIKLVK